jgi:hypothetical protein
LKEGRIDFREFLELVFEKWESIKLEIFLMREIRMFFK